jgi:RNA polymerase sigma factor for flagellar operon FliA
MVSDTDAAARRSRGGRVIDGAHENGRPGQSAAEGEESTESLLRRYRRRRLQSLRDRVVERHRPIVESMARVIAARLPPHVDTQDLVHAGMWGLMQAISSYEPDRSDCFVAFMRIRVRGAMLDELRQMDFLPRLIRRRLRQYDDALLRLRMMHGREPTHVEVADELGISSEMLVRWQNRVGGAALRRDPIGEAVEHIVDEGNEPPIEPMLRAELLELVRAALPPLEWKVLRLLYLEGMTGRQVARRLRLSASRICQIHGRVLDRLKQRLQPAV